MKILLAGLVTFASITASADGFTCYARLLQGQVYEGELVKGSNGHRSANFHGFVYDVVEDSARPNTLNLSVVNTSIKNSRAVTTGPVPAKDQYLTVTLGLAKGNAHIECKGE